MHFNDGESQSHSCIRISKSELFTKDDMCAHSHAHLITDKNISYAISVDINFTHILAMPSFPEFFVRNSEKINIHFD